MCVAASVRLRSIATYGVFRCGPLLSKEFGYIWRTTVLGKIQNASLSVGIIFIFLQKMRWFLLMKLDLISISK